MKIRYAKIVGVVSIMIGLIFSCLTLTVLGSSNGVFVALAGVFMIYFGIVYLTKPCFFVNDNRLEVYGAFGNSIATYNFQSLQEIKIEGNSVFVNQDGNRRKIPISLWMVDKNDWQTFVQKVGKVS